MDVHQMDEVDPDNEVLIEITETTFKRMYPDANFQHFVSAAKYAEAPVTEGAGVRVMSDQR